MAEVLSQALRNETFPEQGIRPCHPRGHSPLRPSMLSSKASVLGNPLLTTLRMEMYEVPSEQT